MTQRGWGPGPPATQMRLWEGQPRKRSAQGSLQLTGVRPKACSCHHGTFALATDMAHIKPSSSLAWAHPLLHPIFLLETQCRTVGGVTENGFWMFDPGLAELFWDRVRGGAFVGEGVIAMRKVSKVHARPSLSVCLSLFFPFPLTCRQQVSSQLQFQCHACPCAAMVATRTVADSPL